MYMTVKQPSCSKMFIIKNKGSTVQRWFDRLGENTMQLFIIHKPVRVTN